MADQFLQLHDFQMPGAAPDFVAAAASDPFMAAQQACWHTKPDFMSLITQKFNDGDDLKDNCGANE